MFLFQLLCITAFRVANDVQIFIFVNVSSLFTAAIGYELYIWEFGEVRPKEPYAITSNTFYTPDPMLPENTQILWQIDFVVFEESQKIPSPIWGFRTRSYPDLKVSGIVVPDFTYSGTMFDIQYTVQNLGGANTAYPNRHGITIRSWHDVVYIGQ